MKLQTITKFILFFISLILDYLDTITDIILTIKIF